MKRVAPWLWLCVVVAVLVYLGVRVASGLVFQSDILALLPHAQNGTDGRIDDRVAASLSRRVVFLFGDRDPAEARAAGLAFAAALQRSGLARTVTATLDADTQQRMAAVYFPYRAGLLAAPDRAQLLAGHGQALVDRARALLYGPGGFADASLVARDPFLLLPAFFTDLPLPQSRLTPRDGVLSVRDGDITYTFVSAELAGDVYALTFQDRFNKFLIDTLHARTVAAPGLIVLRTGAIFYASDGSHEAMTETSTIGTVSLLATLGLLLVVFRGVRPMLLGVLAIAVGILCALAACLALFGELHVVALLFGVSLISISVDYALQYLCEYFDPEATTPEQRLRRVLSGVALGLGTTLIGYLTLMLAPFPGLRQIAALSVVGLIASCVTVALWYPILDRPGRATHGANLLALAGLHWQFWEAPALRPARVLLIALLLLLGIVGTFRLHPDDDVRHMQSMSIGLKQQEAEIQRLTGNTSGAQFLVVRGSNTQAMLRTEESLYAPLNAARHAGVLTGFQAAAQFVPSIARQQENRALLRKALIQPYLASYLAALGFDGHLATTPADQSFLTPDMLPKDGPLGLVDALTLSGPGPGAQLVLLSGVTDVPGLRRAIADVPNVRLVSLAEDWSSLFGLYRRQAVGLLAFSAVLMLPALLWRYRWGALRVMAPSVVAVLLTPSLAALLGVAFTFFNAMALVLVLSIGVDYAVFCRETSGVRRPVTMLAVLLAALSTLLSFGLLAASRVFAVHAFGVTMLIGITIAFLLAPAAGSGAARRV